MILRGILDNSLGQYCIRGYAYLNDLEKISRADLSFQRNLIAYQEGRIRGFLENNPNLFFPEVILSYQVKYDFSKSGSKSINPLGKIINGEYFRSNVDEIIFSSRKVDYKSQSDSRGTFDLKVVTVTIDNQFVEECIENESEPFLRIDGNHRLSAAKAFDSSSIKELVTPFCLILLPEKTDSDKFQKTIFHNINSKTIPLTPEEVYRVVLDDAINFSDAYLKESRDFGLHYVHARQIIENIQWGRYPKLEAILKSENGEESYRTVFVDLFWMLSEEGKLKEEPKREDVPNALHKVNIIYQEYNELNKTHNIGLLTTFLYYAYQKAYFELEWFTEWVLDNRIFEIRQSSSNDLKSIFNKIILSRERTIFISMPFGDSVTENHFTFMSNLIREINEEKKAHIKLFPLRIDKYNNGTAYKISDEILDKIASSGLLIADLTKSNPNVYHEVGYLMGLFREREHKKLNLITIVNTSHTLFQEIGFNIRAHKTIGFEDTNELKEPLKAEIVNYYFKE